jgi:hypothetical protein
MVMDRNAKIHTYIYRERGDERINMKENETQL